MIAASTAAGKPIRILGSEGIFGFHSTFGFVSREAVAPRERSRKRRGLKTTGDWKFQIAIRRDGETAKVEALEGCEVRAREQGWVVATALGDFLLDRVQANAAIARNVSPRPVENAKPLAIALAVAAVLAIAFVLWKPEAPLDVAPIVMQEPIEVKIQRDVQKSVNVAEFAEKLVDRKAKVAVAQNLGFLSLLGRKDLTTKAMGGLPTVPGASAGAGAGGTEGSGGELLVGLGQGVKRTTVGNSGVAGLGGLGTKGKGGGAGGYGNSELGSGNGKGLSSIPLSQDMVLEGGLDRSVIQATIAKYLNQVRACYEEGLRRSPGLVGQVSVAFEISGAGGVTTSNVSKTSLGDAEVEGCISQKVLGWQFPRPRGGVSVKVNYPFMLRPVKAG